MSKDSVQNGVVVSMEYTLKIDGEVIDSSEGQDPWEFLTGYGNIISGLEREMIGLKVGESKDVVVMPTDGYGEYDEEAYLDVPKDQFPADMQVEEGMELTVRDDSGEGRYARIETVEGENIRLNFNHPLAGDELHFSFKVVALREPTDEELDHGHAHAGGLAEQAAGLDRQQDSSDRMGLRLEGPPLEPAIRADLLTEGVCLGAVQVPADLRPIVLFVEHQTTGGYAKIANVISADFHALGQLRPRDSVRFEPVSLQAALALLRAQEEAFHALLD